MATKEKSAPNKTRKPRKAKFDKNAIAERLDSAGIRMMAPGGGTYEFFTVRANGDLRKVGSAASLAAADCGASLLVAGIAVGMARERRRWLTASAEERAEFLKPPTGSK